MISLTRPPSSVTNANALIDDPDWCGHAFVSLRTWTCATCERPVTDAARARLTSLPTAAPPGYLWMLTEARQDPDAEEGFSDRWALGVFRDRARIPWLLVRHRHVTASVLRRALEEAHWYQGAFNPWCFEGWAEVLRPGSWATYHEVRAVRIDQPGFVSPRQGRSPIVWAT